MELSWNRHHMNRSRLLRLFVMLLMSFSTLLSGCSTMGSNTKGSIHSGVDSVNFTAPADQQIVIIYNHGIQYPQQREPCFMWYNKPPPSLKAQINANTLIYSLCSTSIESPLPTSAGKQVYLRKKEINFAIDAFLARGIQPKHIFLAGHSNGGWTSLMMMRDVNKRFNGAIAYAPAFAGKRSDISFAPWWRNTARPKQVKDMLGASQMDALVFAYENDVYNRPQDLVFLKEHYPYQGDHGVSFISYDCQNKSAHQTFRNDCHLARTKQQIGQFINSQIETWNN